MKSPQILVVDDEESLRHMLTVMLRKQGFVVDTADSGLSALQMLERQVYDYILCDIRMPQMDGSTFLQQALERGVSAPIIMMTAYGTVDTAVACMQQGAYDFISKPFKRDEIVIVLKKAEERERLKEENRQLRAAADVGGSFFGIVGRNPVMRQLYDQIGRVADLKTTVLLLGESGTGKELVARAIHSAGRRAEGPFVAVNCGALPENLLESELFGHVKGAFTGAVSDKAGLFEQAHGGTLMLDEVGEMPASLQVKLLRVLQEGELRPVGGGQVRAVDVRVVSATARDLQAEVAAGRFREDLYFRLNVVSLQLPPLRERIDDLPLLAEQFLRRCSARIGKNTVPRLSADAVRAMMAYGWPGNVRELENRIERALVLSDHDLVTAQELNLPGAQSGTAAALALPTGSLSLKQAERALEVDMIRRALEHTGGNRTQAAKVLEISHRSLLYKLKEYGLE